MSYKADVSSVSPSSERNDSIYSPALAPPISETQCYVFSECSIAKSEVLHDRERGQNWTTLYIAMKPELLKIQMWGISS